MARPVILVVDDDPGVRESFRLILEDHYDVVDVPDGPSALEVVRASPVDLVLLDIRLPGMDGIETIREVRTQQPDLPAIVISGTSLDGPGLQTPDFLAMAVKTGITLEDLAYMENVYSPPIGALNEPIALAAQNALANL